MLGELYYPEEGYEGVHARTEINSVQRSIVSSGGERQSGAQGVGTMHDYLI